MSMKVLIQQALKDLHLNKDFLNHRIDTATDGEEALAKFTQRAAGVTYALVLMDCQMPIMDGYTASKEIRKHATEQLLAQPRIVACSGNEDEGHFVKAWAAEMDEAVSKPASVEILKEIL